MLMAEVVAQVENMKHLLEVLEQEAEDILQQELAGGGAGGGAGMHIQGGGGYSPGLCQFISDGTQYHNGTYPGDEPLRYAEGNSGGAYFSGSKYDNRTLKGKSAGAIGGQGRNE